MTLIVRACVWVVRPPVRACLRACVCACVRPEQVLVHTCTEKDRQTILQTYEALLADMDFMRLYAVINYLVSSG